MMIKGYQTEILSIYDKIRDDESRALKARKKEISEKYPEIIDIDNEIQKLSLKMSLSILRSSKANETLADYKDKITNLRAKKYELLVSKGYPQDYLTLHYKCNKCKDTGFIGQKKCSCYKDKLIQIYYKDSHLEDILKEKNFDSFNLSLFSTHKIGDEKYSPRKNMENILQYTVKDYLPNFRNINTNLLFYGDPGSGKSFLSYCIAKELLDSGNLVVYKTADEVISDLKDIKFNNNYRLEEFLIDCDLLIIDDLGAEQKNEFALTELFNLLNKKLLKNKKMLISTNLSLPTICQIYSERFSSRLLGEFKLFKFYSEDIRITLNLKNQ